MKPSSLSRFIHVKAFFKLIRVQNLFIVALTQYLMRWCIIHPILGHISVVRNGEVVGLPFFELQFSEVNFFLLVLSTVFLTAAGYVINDYFDTKTDLVNHPGKVIVGKSIPRRTAMGFHIVFNILGVGIGAYIAFLVRMPFLIFIFVIVTGLLWFYSTTYKRQFLIGNLIVALLTALVPLMVILFEIPLLNRAYGQILLEYNTNLNLVIAWVGGFSFFAFITTLTREIIKDIEDFEGDNAYGRKTMPIMLGVRNSKWVVIGLSTLTVSALVIVFFRYLKDIITLIYMSVALFLPFILLTYRMIKADKKSDYRFASNLSKMIMLAGIIYSLVVYFIITVTF